jgi:hypothetical protein
LAGELPAYSGWIRKQRCAGCLGPGPCDPHHAHCGTTYDPDERPPTKSAGPKRGRGQRSHDKWLIPMHMRCHRQFTDSSGPYRDWNNERRDAWERDQVRIHRERYAAEASPAAASDTATSRRVPRKRVGSGWSVATIRDWLRKEAPTRPAPVADALTELANLIEEDTL